MPDNLMQSLIDARLATIGHSYKAQVSYGLADLRIHKYESAEDIPQSFEELYNATNLDYSRYYTVPNDTALLASFGHFWNLAAREMLLNQSKRSSEGTGTLTPSSKRWE